MTPEEEARLAEMLARSADRHLAGEAVPDEDAEIAAELEVAELFSAALEDAPPLSETADRRIRRAIAERAAGAATKAAKPAAASRRPVYMRYVMAAAFLICMAWGVYVTQDLNSRQPGREGAGREVVVLSPELEALTVPFSGEFDDTIEKISERRTQRKREEMMREIQMRRLFERRFKT